MTLKIGFHSDWKHSNKFQTWFFFLKNELQRLKKYKENCFQTFSGDKISTSLKKKFEISENEQKDIQQIIYKNKIIFVFHEILNLNFASPLSKPYFWNFQNVWYDIQILQHMANKNSKIVIHMGSYLTKRFQLSKEEGIQNWIDNTKYLLKQMNEKKYTFPKILFETPSTFTNKIGANLEDYKHFFKSFSKKEQKQIGFCLDTAHLFVLGYPIHTLEGIQNIFKVIHPSWIGLIHLNDATHTLGSMHDVHCSIATGHIFDPERGGSLISLKKWLEIAKENSIPCILETRNEQFHEELDFLRKVEKTNSKKIEEIQKNKKKWKIYLPKYYGRTYQLMETEYEIKGGFKHSTISKNNKKRSKTNYAIKVRHFHETKNPLENEVAQSLTKKSKKNSKKHDWKEDILFIFSELELFHTLLPAKNKNKATPFRIRGYHQAIQNIMSNPYPIYNKNDIDLYYSHLGLKTIEKMKEIIKTKGHLKMYNEIKNIPWFSLRKELLKIKGFGSVFVNKMITKGITSINDLKKMVKKGDITLTKMQELGLKYVEILDEKIPRKRIEEIRNEIEKKMKKVDPYVKMFLAGSYRTGKQYSGDIDLIISNKKWNTLNDVRLNVETLLKSLYSSLEAIFSKGEYHISGIYKYKETYQQVDLRFIPHPFIETYLLYFGSGVEFSRLIRQHAKKLGYKLTEWGLEDVRTGKQIEIYDEKGIMKFLGLQYMEPKKRRGITTLVKQ